MQTVAIDSKGPDGSAIHTVQPSPRWVTVSASSGEGGNNIGEVGDKQQLKAFEQLPYAQVRKYSALIGSKCRLEGCLLVNYQKIFVFAFS
jgi:hypothetical protein